MSIFNTREFQAERQKVEIVDSEFVNTGIAEIIPFEGTIHAIPGKELKSLSVGREIIEGQVLITDVELLTAELKNSSNYKPDIVEDLKTGTKYEVVKIMSASNEIIDHFEYLIDIKKENN